jgi:hypothetical protein
VTAGASIGDTHGTFASINLGRVHDDNLHDNAAEFSGRAGLGIPVPSAPATELCPFVSLQVINGWNLPTGESVSLRDYGAGLGVGGRVRADPAFEVVPFASVARVLGTSAIKAGGPSFAGNDVYYTAAGLGVGFVIRDAFTITPFASFAIAQGETEKSYGLRVSFAFGRVIPRPSPAPGDGSLANVWVNPRAMLYYCSGSQSFGATSGGSFMTERDALAAGYTPERGKRC